MNSQSQTVNTVDKLLMSNDFEIYCTAYYILCYNIYLNSEKAAIYFGFTTSLEESSRVRYGFILAFKKCE